MSATVHMLASGSGWSVADIVCVAGPGERPFEERHETVCIAIVTQGTFRYRAAQGTAVMSPGAILLGNPGGCFECGHDHGRGDRCLSFHFAVDLFERVVAAAKGARKSAFRRPQLPPVTELAPLVARAEAARGSADVGLLEEIAIELAGAIVELNCDGRVSAAVGTSARDEKRISDAVRLIELHADEAISLEMLADAAATSPFHFLRSFRSLVGLTPYQYLLRTRLHRAAVRLRATDEPVSTIAYAAGFNDLATFNRRFRKIMGQPPTIFRAAG